MNISDDELNKWYASCEFIENNMKFYSFKDFYNNKKRIKYIYDHKDIRTKKLYKWYVYSNSMSYKLKCAIWSYLNNDIDDYILSKYL